MEWQNPHIKGHRLIESDTALIGWGGGGGALCQDQQCDTSSSNIHKKHDSHHSFVDGQYSSSGLYKQPGEALCNFWHYSFSPSKIVIFFQLDHYLILSNATFLCIIIPWEDYVSP